jgi:hypothetical protein
LALLAPAMRHFSWETLWPQLLNAQRLLSSGNDGRLPANTQRSHHLHIPQAFKPASIVALADCLMRTSPAVETLCFQVVLPRCEVDSRTQHKILAQQAAYTAAACLLLRALPSLPSLWRVKLKLMRDRDAKTRRNPSIGWVSPRGINAVMAALTDAVGRCTALRKVCVIVEDDGE